MLREKKNELIDRKNNKKKEMTANDEIFLPKCKLPYYSKLCCSSNNTTVNTRPSAGVQSANMTNTNSLLHNSVSSKSLTFLSSSTSSTTTTYRSTTSSATCNHHRRPHRYENHHYYQTATTRIKMSSKHKRILDALIKKV